MAILPQFAPGSFTAFPLLPPPPKRLALSAPKIAGLLPTFTSPPTPLHEMSTSLWRGESERRKVRLEIAQTPENQARMADSLADLLGSIGPLLTMDDAYAVIERHNRIYHERRAKREAEHARNMVALNDWWNQYLAARDTPTRQALIAARPSMLQAAEVQS